MEFVYLITVHGDDMHNYEANEDTIIHEDTVCALYYSMNSLPLFYLCVMIHSLSVNNVGAKGVASLSSGLQHCTNLQSLK